MSTALRMEAAVDDKATGPLRRIREELAAFRETEGMKSLRENMGVLREQTSEFGKAVAGTGTLVGGLGVAGLAASLSVGKLVESFKALAERSQELKSLSKETGLTVDGINRLEETASRFGVAPEAMGQALSTLADKMVDFRRHTGDVFNNLVDQKGGKELIEKLLGDNPEQQVQDIFKFLDTLQPQMRRRYSELFFGNGDIARVVQDGMGKFSEEYGKAAASLPKLTAEYQAQARAFTDSIHDFNLSLDQLEMKAGPAIFGELKHALEDFRHVFDEIKGVYEWFQANKDKRLKDFADDNAKAAGKAFDDDLKTRAQRNEELAKQGKGPAFDLPGLLNGQKSTGDAHKTFQEQRRNLNPLFHQSAFTSWEGGSGSAGGTLGGSDVLTRSVRAGVLAALQDYADLARAQQESGGGGGVQAAAYTVWGSGGGPAGGAGGGSMIGGPAGAGYAQRAAAIYESLKGDASKRERMDFIRAEAARQGIDPDTALLVAHSEGLNKFSGDRGTSFGDFQLHVGGGLGDTFRRQTGLDPSDPANWKAMDRFALQQARKGGWSPFHGAARVGIGAMEGIGSGDGTASAGAPGAAVDKAMALDHQGISGAAAALGSRMTPGQWCADFVNGAFKAAGMKGVNSSMALAFKSWGHAVGLNDIRKGDVLMEDHGGGHGHAMLATGQRDKRGWPMVVEGNYGGRVHVGPEDPRKIAAARRANIWEGAKAAGGAGEHTVKHTGGAEITIVGLPKGASTHTKASGLIDSVKVDRASTMPDLIWGST